MRDTWLQIRLFVLGFELIGLPAVLDIRSDETAIGVRVWLR